MNLNCYSLINNEKKLEQLLVTHKPGIILAAEAHLNQDNDSKYVFNEIYLNSPPKRKGNPQKFRDISVLIATKNDLILVEKETNAENEIKYIKVWRLNWMPLSTAKNEMSY